MNDGAEVGCRFQSRDVSTPGIFSPGKLKEAAAFAKEIRAEWKEMQK